MDLGKEPVQLVTTMLRYFSRDRNVPDDAVNRVEKTVEEPNQWNDTLKETTKIVAVTTVAGTGTAVVGTTVGTTALSMAGFTGSGIAAGSLAAGAQASIGNVVAGSAFASLQSVGATGGLALLGPVGLGLAVAGGTVALGVIIYKKVNKTPKSE